MSIHPAYEGPEEYPIEQDGDINDGGFQPYDPEEMIRKLESALASATAYIDMAAYLLEEVEDAADLSEIQESLFDARERIDEIRSRNQQTL